MIISIRSSDSVAFLPYLVEGVWLDLGKFVFHVVRVHRADLLSSRCTQNFDDLDQLVNA